ncbi:IclR family transcriptional regulator [Micromonospora craniellae]|uniref:IclR family transcriptional regulator n=1 Tax=Micromonospora craniellae TaxID=2294034 RepID=A0A372FZC1_9ACTN|nr:IclR family transcriptional regulator [Micromonospora craniellae]QOC93405.1 IclR family transcriptional regulator [Micromonospora craniellae]RFS45850.1 IclR family transcriptional regulator [Micromonospora craniellae]
MGETMDTAIDKALIILESLETGRNRCSLAEIAARTGMPKPTVHRILAILERRGYVQQLSSREYTLGPKIIALGIFAGGKDAMVSAARPVLDRLVLACRETVHLGVLYQTQLLYLDRREPEDTAVRLARLPSPLTSLHASASGKVLLAFGEPDLLDQVVTAGLVGYTERTIVDVDRLRAELERIRVNGYAVSEQERYEGVRAVGVPVRHRSGAVVAALSAAGPVQRFDQARVEHVRTLLTKAADELSLSLH